MTSAAEFMVDSEINVIVMTLNSRSHVADDLVKTRVIISQKPMGRKLFGHVRYQRHNHWSVTSSGENWINLTLTKFGDGLELVNGLETTALWKNHEDCRLNKRLNSEELAFFSKLGSWQLFYFYLQLMQTPGAVKTCFALWSMLPSLPDAFVMNNWSAVT